MSLDLQRLLVVFAIVLVATPAAAQFGRTHHDGALELSLQGGYDLPQGALSDFSDNGFSAGVGLAYRMAPRLFVGAEVQHHGYRMSNSLSDAFGDDLAMSLSVQQFAATGKYLLHEGARRYYVKGTGGMFRGEASVRLGSASSNGDTFDPGAAISVGYQLMGTSGSATFFEVGYHRMFSAGENLDWFSASMGANFFFLK